MRGRILSLIRMSSTKVSEDTVRSKPFIVICGCTGTGKTKLSIQLAEWLIKSGKKSEIINADAMQLYKNLDIITNKATVDEMKGVKHHLIGYLDATTITSHVIDYKTRAVPLIDELLKNDVIPILVGGTHYYIQSVIWDLLIENEAKKPEIDESKSGKIPNKIDLNATDNNSKIVQLILDCIEKSSNKNEDGSNEYDLNVALHDSTDITNEEIYKQLEQVDMQSAKKIHPNDRRKICRALQIYYTHGVTKTELLELKNKQDETGKLKQAPLRYKNVCLFAMNCETETLNKRLDDRVDQMISNGLLKEIESFKSEFEAKIKGQTFKEYSRDFEFGIFQSIGFKEFDDYLSYIDENKNKKDEQIFEKTKQNLFDQAVADMKLSTRRYAKTQVKWVKNRFIKRADLNSPIVYELDTTNLDKWNENIFDKAASVFKDYLDTFEDDVNVDINKIKRSSESLAPNEEKEEEIHEFNKCKICDRIFIDRSQWTAHLESAKHKKRENNLKKREQNILMHQLKLLKEQKEKETLNEPEKAQI